MTIKEITALRKAGKLEEALISAENEYSKNANVYTIGALFWCLNDLYKQQQGDEAAATYERMKQLYEELGSYDEFMANTLSWNERVSLPHSQELKEALEQAKAGVNPIQKYVEIVRYYNAKELDERLFSDFGWLIYYSLKVTPLNDAYNRKLMLAKYMELPLERPSILHSLILSEAVKVEQSTPLQFRIRDFIKMWGIENLRAEDWEQFRTEDGKTLPSLVEKLIGVYAKELKTDGVAAEEDMISLVDEALMRYPNSQNLPYSKAIILLSLGRNEEALKYYQQLILRFPTKSYLWHHASAIVTDIDTKIGLLCKALSTGDDEAFLGGVHLSLANLLLEKGLSENAKAELETYRKTYQSKGWNLKKEFHDMYNRLAAETAAADNASLYAQYASYADQFIYSELPSEYVVKVADQKLEDRNRSGKFFVQWTLKGEKTIYRLKKPARYGLDTRTANGAMFEIKIHDNKIVWIKAMKEYPTLSWLKSLSGTVTLRTNKMGKKFAIIDGVYIPEKLVENLVDGQSINVIAVKQEDDRWQAIATI